ncbi:hypothetical protein GCM10020001_094190 [Nonomuraea salmonea]
MVEQEGGGDAGVAGVGAGDAGVDGQLVVLRGFQQGALDVGAQRAGGVVQHLGEHPAQRGSRLAGGEGVNPGAQARQAEPVEEGGGGGGGAEAAQAVEGGEGAHHLGLVGGVLVRAGAVVERDAPGVLGGVAGLGLLGGGVDLEGERALDGEDLEQVGQLGAEALGGGGAPRVTAGSWAMSSYSGTPPAVEGAPRWAPIQSSACGSPVGSVPNRRGRAVTEPQS